MLLSRFQTCPSCAHISHLGPAQSGTARSCDWSAGRVAFAFSALPAAPSMVPADSLGQDMGGPALSCWTQGCRACHVVALACGLSPGLGPFSVPTHCFCLFLCLSVTDRGGPVAGGSLAGGPACPPSFGPPPWLWLWPSYHSAPRPMEACPVLVLRTPSLCCQETGAHFDPRAEAVETRVGKCRGCELCPHPAPRIHKAKPWIPLSCSVPSPGPGVWAAWGPGGREAAGPGSLSAPALST